MTPEDLFDVHRVLAVAVSLLTADQRTRLCNVLGMPQERLEQLFNLAWELVTHGPAQRAHCPPDLVWRIRCRRDMAGEPQYWSHELGWTEQRSADLFSEQDHASLLLPIGGVWERRT